jgi:transposase
MPFESRRPSLKLSGTELAELGRIASSRTEATRRVERARILLAYHDGKTVSDIARTLQTSRPTVERSLNKAMALGSLPALEDLPGRGKAPLVTAEAKTWLLSVACQKPKELGFAQELWTTALLAKYARERGPGSGHPSLGKLGRGTVSKILRRAKVRPHKITYYLERRDEEFDAKMAQVLCVYREVQMARDAAPEVGPELTAWLSYDEKPGIQALSATAPDLPPVPLVQPTIARDYEYVRHGTMSLLAGLDLLTGKVFGMVADRHRSAEFIEFLMLVDGKYPPDWKIRLVLDNHSSHLSKQTRAFLETRPNRFEFIFTPKHGSWLNLVESFFGKMARTLLRAIRVKSKEELRERILRYLDEVNEAPVVYRWRYKMDELSVA